MNVLGGSAWPTATVQSGAQTSENPTHGQTGGTTLPGAAERLWQTPVSDDAPDRAKGKINSRGEPKLSGQAEIAHDVTPRGSGQVPSAKAGNRCLATDAIQWSTPKGSDGPKGGPGQAYGSGGTPPLPAQAATWPTPAAQNVKGSSQGSVTRADGKSRMDILHYRAEQGFTRPAPVTQPHGPKWSQLAPILRRLRASLIASHGRATWRRMMKTRHKRRLNPLFVEWLMGWPPGHALCVCSATEFIHWQRRMRGALSAMPMASGPWIWEPPADERKPHQMKLGL